MKLSIGEGQVRWRDGERGEERGVRRGEGGERMREGRGGRGGGEREAGLRKSRDRGGGVVLVWRQRDRASHCHHESVHCPLLVAPTFCLVSLYHYFNAKVVNWVKQLAKSHC